MAKDDDEDLPDKDAAKGFYAKYEPKEILGRYVLNVKFWNENERLTFQSKQNNLWALNVHGCV